MRFKWILSGTLITVILFAVFVLIVAAAEYFTALSEGLAMILIYIAMAWAVFAGTFFAVRKSGTKALPTAMTVALFLIAVLVTASLATNGTISTNSRFISIIAGIIFASFLGAVVGR